MSAPVEQGKKIWTEAEIEALPEDGSIHEVVDGELVMSPKNNFQHEQICAELLTVLRVFARQHHLGAVSGSSLGYWMHNRNCRAPDISFIPKERLIRLGFRPSTRQFFPGAPDLAVEVLSPNSTRAEIEARLKDFFSSGTQIAWIINPITQSADVYYSLEKRRSIGPEGILEGEHLLPGFRYPLADLFTDTDWE